LKVQGFPQQSALLVHSVPSGTGVAQLPTNRMRQRGMPSASSLQQFSGWLLQFWPAGWPNDSQQLFAVLHELSPPSLQMRPGSLHDAPPGPHRPYASDVAFFTQTMGCPDFGSGEPDHPQQSLSTWQSSPTG
jgi:hypothetical protein